MNVMKQEKHLAEGTLHWSEICSEFSRHSPEDAGLGISCSLAILPNFKL